MAATKLGSKKPDGRIGDHISPSMNGNLHGCRSVDVYLWRQPWQLA